MRLRAKPEPAADLLALLGEERRALLSGDLGQLGSLTARKERLLQLLEESLPTGAEQIATLKTEFAHNQSLLEAAATGVRSVMDRLKAMRQVRETLSTYDAAGQVRHAPTPQPRQLDGRK